MLLMYLQYKMFLLNSLQLQNQMIGVWFTIQNVPIKYRRTRLLKRIWRHLQYKMFLLNLSGGAKGLGASLIYNTKCSY